MLKTKTKISQIIFELLTHIKWEWRQSMTKDVS